MGHGGEQEKGAHFRMKDRSLFAFAGLWEFWTDGAEKLATCCLITTDANELVGSIHNRMPVILPSSPTVLGSRRIRSRRNCGRF